MLEWVMYTFINGTQIKINKRHKLRFSLWSFLVHFLLAFLHYRRRFALFIFIMLHPTHIYSHAGMIIDQFCLIHIIKSFIKSLFRCCVLCFMSALCSFSSFRHAETHYTMQLLKCCAKVSSLIVNLALMQVECMYTKWATFLLLT